MVIILIMLLIMKSPDYKKADIEDEKAELSEA